MSELKKYLVSYTIEWSSGVSFYNAIVECDGSPVAILKRVRELEGEIPNRVNLINFWEI